MLYCMLLFINVIIITFIIIIIKSIISSKKGIAFLKKYMGEAIQEDKLNKIINDNNNNLENEINSKDKENNNSLNKIINNFKFNYPYANMEYINDYCNKYYYSNDDELFKLQQKIKNSNNLNLINKINLFFNHKIDDFYNSDFKIIDIISNNHAIIISKKDYNDYIIKVDSDSFYECKDYNTVLSFCNNIINENNYKYENLRRI